MISLVAVTVRGLPKPRVCALVAATGDVGGRGNKRHRGQKKCLCWAMGRWPGMDGERRQACGGDSDHWRPEAEARM